ncbi:MAG: hypothetical protein K8H89_02345 [Flavobacteriales bacterium]|jgi:hypothetical protein|nr:hypothetical protein [Flavobacteriales bacterium]MCB0759513.1 hypothetical protein [Flavobacteriales bacterium]
MRHLVILLSTLLLLTTACKKEPGEGGKAVIKGTVMRQNVNALGIPQGDPYPYQDTRVYIIYGDNDFHDDDVRTGPDGNYEFRWLRKGDYTVYTFGECDCPGNSVEVSRKVTIDGKKDVVTVPTIIVDNF